MEVPTNVLVPMVWVSGLSVLLRMVKHGTPKTVVSSEIPPESVITAKLFFQHRGYHVVRKQEVIRHGVALTNFVMEKRSERTR